MPLALKQTVTTNGTYDMGNSPTNSFSYKIDGVFGSASVEVGYMSNGVFVKYTDVAAITTAAQAVLTCGQGSSVAFRVTAATGTTALNLTINPVVHQVTV